MKYALTLLLSGLLLAMPASAQLNPSKSELAKIQWQDISLSQKNETHIATLANKLAGTSGSVVAYKIPANQGALKLNLASVVQKDNTIFIPHALILDSQLNPSMYYPSSQFKFSEERGLNPAQYHAELNLTPTANQDFIYLLVYTTTQDLQGKTIMTHPAKLLAKAKGNQPPAIADIELKHSHQGKITLEVESGQSGSQLIGLFGNTAKAEPTAVKTTQTPIQPKPQQVESSTEDYFNQAVLKALKNKDINKAMNLVNEAEQLGLTQPRQLFIRHLSK